MLEFDELVTNQGLHALLPIFTHTRPLDTSDANVECIMVKMDGSIISTFMHEGNLCVKSKTSLESEHAAMALKWLNEPNQAALKQALTKVTARGFAVHMELTSPTLRIVVGYEQIGLTILGMTHNEFPTQYFSNINNPDSIFIILSVSDLVPYWVPRWNSGYAMPDGSYGTKEYIESIKEQVGTEGIVVRYNNGEMTKHKTDWYCALHHTKDSVSSSRRLFECVINEATDDLKAMFADDPITIQRIVDMENLVIPKYNHIQSSVESFYEQNKHLGRKEYAILGQSIKDHLFGLKMNLYVNKPNDYKAFAIKNIQLFGIHDTEEVQDVD